MFNVCAACEPGFSGVFIPPFQGFIMIPCIARWASPIADRCRPFRAVWELRNLSDGLFSAMAGQNNIPSPLFEDGNFVHFSGESEKSEKFWSTIVANQHSYIQILMIITGMA